MPNGGPDNCGTCVFNLSYDSTVGYMNGAHAHAFCRIRNLAVADPFYTYCANMQFHNERLIQVPVGPVYGALPLLHVRYVAEPAPDSTAIRDSLIALLESMDVRKMDSFDAPTMFEHDTVRHIIQNRDPRAARGLKRILLSRWQNLATRDGKRKGVLFTLAGLAAEALAAIDWAAFQEFLPQVRAEPFAELHSRCTSVKVDIEGETAGGTTIPPEEWPETTDHFGIVRYHLVRALRHCPPPMKRPLIRSYSTAEDPVVAHLAGELCRRTEDLPDMSHGLPRYEDWHVFVEKDPYGWFERAADPSETRAEAPETQEEPGNTKMTLVLSQEEIDQILASIAEESLRQGTEDRQPRTLVNRIRLLLRRLSARRSRPPDKPSTSW